LTRPERRGAAQTDERRGAAQTDERRGAAQTDERRGAAQTDERRGKAPQGAPEPGRETERPGDPACLLRRVCPACGSVAAEDPPTICPHCHAELTAS
jgi:rubrerythrin